MAKSIPPVTFQTLIDNYKRLQSALVSDVRELARNMSEASPGDFLLVQFKMAQVTQIGESISNLISQINSIINNAVRNQKTQ